MSKKVLSIEVGNSLTKICEIEYETKRPKVYRVMTVHTPVGTIEDGMLNNTEELVSNIVHVLTGSGIRTRDAIFTVTPSKIASREVQIPNVKENRILSLIKANANEYFPIDLSSYEIGYYTSGETAENGQLKVIAVAVPQSLLQSYTELATACGLTVVAFDYSTNSLYRILSGRFAEETAMILKVDEVSTVAMIMQKDRVLFQRTIPYGVDDAIETVISTGVYEVYEYSDALKLLRRKTCINRTLRPDALEWELEGAAEDEPESEQIADARSRITQALENMIGGITRMLEFYNSRNSETPVEKIYLTGLGGDFSGLSKLLTNCLEQKVVLLTGVETVVFGRNLKDASFGEYIACLGAVIHPVGLMHEDEKAQKKKMTLVKGTNYTFVSVAVLVLCILVSGLMSMMAINRYNEAKTQQNTLNAQIAELSWVDEMYDEYAAAKAQYDKYQFYYEYTETPNENLVAFINELEEILPSSFYTNSFTSDETGISMSVTVTGKEAAALTIKNIRDMDSIQNVSVSGISDVENEDGESVVTFSISGTYADIHAETNETEGSD